MTGERKLSDADVQRLRALASEGVAAVELARQFGVSRRHVDRLVKGEQRREMTQTARAVEGDVTTTVVAYLDALRLEGRDAVLAATARALAGKIDAAAVSDAAAAAAAMPTLSRQLMEVLGDLSERHREPDMLDILKHRRLERLERAARAAREDGAA